jgi:hypothetical protein
MGIDVKYNLNKIIELVDLASIGYWNQFKYLVSIV